MALSKEQQRIKKRVQQMLEFLGQDYDTWLIQKHEEFIDEKTDEVFDIALKKPKSESSNYGNL